jgi:hypothetical protein
MKRLIRFNLVLGAWLVVAPFVFDYYTLSPSAMWNDIIFGLVILACSWCVLTEVPGQAACSSCAMLAGAWLMIAPFALNYRVEAVGNDVIVGALVLVISAIETWRIGHKPSTLA